MKMNKAKVLEILKNANKEKVEEYIIAFEDGEGLDCWERFFANEKQVLADFALYCEYSQ